MHVCMNVFIYNSFHFIIYIFILKGLPIHRPNDYFCENMKTDAHMAKIKDKLLIE